MTDIDHFKAVNNQYGRQAGDQVLEFFVAVWNVIFGRIWKGLI